MGRKRGNGEGTIIRETVGKYKGRYRIVLRWMVNGALKYRSRVAWKHADALAALDELRAERDSGIVDSRMTVEQYLLHWLSLQDSEASTRDSYRNAIQTHIGPGIGHYKIHALTPLQIEEWWAKFEAGDRTREHVYVVLRTGLDHAVRSKVLAESPLTFKKPKYQRDKIEIFTLEESRRIMRETEDTRWHALAVLALTSGLRIGELLGLEWSKIDFRKRLLTIDQQAVDDPKRGVIIKRPKSSASIRTIDLSGSAVQALRSHQAIQLRAGLASCKFIFPTLNGTLMSRNNVRTHWWDPLLRRLGIAHRGIHHARHTYATHALMVGIPATVVAKILGHSKPSTTLDIYGHLLHNSQAQAAEVVSRLFG